MTPIVHFLTSELFNFSIGVFNLFAVVRLVRRVSILEGHFCEKCRP